MYNKCMPYSSTVTNTMYVGVYVYNMVIGIYKTDLPFYDAGDVFYLNWDEVLVGATAVVSSIGGFGNEEYMKRINGEATIVAVNAAKDFGRNVNFHFI